MKVLHVTPAFYPATYWGGPIYSTKAICDGMAAKNGITLRVLTTDSAGPAISQRAAPATLPYEVHYAQRVAGHSVAPGLLWRLPQAMRWADVVHLTAVYNTPTLPVLALARMMNKPVVWSPRGALQATQDWVHSPKRRMKHSFAALLNAVRPAQMVMHVTSRQEAEAGAIQFSQIKTRVIPNAVDLPIHLQKIRRTDGQIRLIFLGRVHPKKGVDALIRAMGRLPDTFTLDIYGDGDPTYLTALKEAAADLSGRIRFHGHVAGERKAKAFATADLFVLPSHSENFGIAVAEALAHAVPVLTSQATPWQGLDRHGCGACIDLHESDLASEIAKLAGGDLKAMGARGRTWMQHDFSTAAMISRFDDLYRQMRAPHPREVFV